MAGNQLDRDHAVIPGHVTRQKFDRYMRHASDAEAETIGKIDALPDKPPAAVPSKKQKRKR